jgi:dTDP-4-dehydrorhamnose reductase
MKKILILGSSGLLGTGLEEACQERGENYVSLNHSDIDIRNAGELEKKIEQYEPEVIINSAAMLGIPACEEDPTKAFETNSVSALNLARICNKKDITLVQISSNAIFDGKKGSPYVETDTPNPQNIYGLSKYCGEVCVRNNMKRYYITRLPKLFGGRRNKGGGFVDKMIEKMRKREEIGVAYDRTDPFTYSLHGARRILSLLESKEDFGIYHITNKGIVSYYDFVVRLAEELGYDGPIKRIKDADFKSIYPNPLNTELISEKIKDMPCFKTALKEYLDREKIKL